MSDPDRPFGFCVSAADPRTLATLQFGDVLEAVAGFAATALGAAHVRALRPAAVLRGDTRARDAIVAEHERVEAARRFLGGEEPWPAAPIPDLDAAIARLAIAGSRWSGPELRGAITLLASARRTAAALAGAAARGTDVAALAALAAALPAASDVEAALERIVDDAGAVRDAASPELRRLRHQLRGAEAELIRLLEKLMGGLEPHHRVDDGSVTMRNGRWVIPVRREGRTAVGGIVHDSSSSGATVFVEPPAAVEFGNRIRELEAAEQREVERILDAATDDLRPRGPQLAAALDALVTLDSLVARARFALRYRCEPAVPGAPTAGLAIVDGRHPLLVVQGRFDVVPFSLRLDAHERTLLVSGPNTGGKTVLLKALALLSLMLQAGVPPTVGAGSTIPLFDRVFADIGDEQSIEASLSTFSGHVRNLVEIVESATAESLVLADELGSGTDPTEGAAIGGAVLEALTRRGTMTVATTHLGALKDLAHEVTGVVNASLQFDERELAPTYRLLKGLPGRSYGIHIVRRLRMPADIVARAEARVPEAERTAAALLEDLERRRRELADREREAADREASYAARAARIAERERHVRERERAVEREARTASRRYVLDARREIEAAIAAIRAADAAGVAAAAAAARRTAERLLAAERDAARALDAAEAAEAADALANAAAAAANGAETGAQAGPGAARRGATRPRADLAVGDDVAVAALGGAPAQVLEIRGTDVVVVAGSVRTTVPRSSVSRLARRNADAGARVHIAGAAPDLDAKPEVDLRGMRVSEVDAALLHALDSAVRADLPTLRIIHGKGTGALRDRVGELLHGDPRVRSHRLGAWNEGGAGVTVAELA
jgi:DNA mismatch repair protein MutS2